MKREWFFFGVLVLAIALLEMGCDSSPKANRPAERAAAPWRAGTSSNTPNLDPTATHLHDLAGMLLMYHAAHGELPPTLADAEISNAADPASGRPYIYTPSGGQPKGLPGRI